MPDRRAFGQQLPPESEERIDRLLEEMTLAERVGQMVGTAPREDVAGTVDAVRDHHLGSVHFGGTPHNTPRAKAEFANEVQAAAIDASRFDVPLFLRAMAEHGHAALSGSTVFPQQLGMAATRDPDLMAAVAEVAATEMRATGVHSTSSPIGDVARDARWGRIAETFGESPTLCAAFVEAAVEGYQRGADPVFAVSKHFPAYSEPVRGEDQAPNEVSEYTFRRVHVPPYAAGIDAGTAGIMPCYNSIDGEPVHGSTRFVRDLLRDDLGFDGFVLADARGAEDLHAGHGTSDSREESVWQAIRAGIDLLPFGGPEYAELIVGLVEDGELSEARIDESARRILRLKTALGLFDDPSVDVEDAVDTVGSDDHREVALRAARESMTLLTNDGALPLSPEDDVFVAGPCADNIAFQHGGWGSVEDPRPLGDTVLDGIRRVADGDVTYEKGATIDERLDLDAAREGAADADVAVVVLGEPDYVHEFRASTLDLEIDDFPKRTQLTLPDAQLELARAVHETGTPTIGILVTGRVLATPWLAEALPALLMAYQPGSEGRAVADVLFGECDPGGRLPMSVPRSEAHIPVRFNYLPHPKIAEDVHVDSYDPLFPYGHGLSYTEFSYGGLELSAEEVGPDGTVEATVTVENVGDRSGVDTVEVFVNDVLSSRVTPVRELAGFERVELDPGESAEVTFELGREELGVVRNDGSREVEPGAFEVIVGDRVETFEVARRRPFSR